LRHLEPLLDRLRMTDGTVFYEYLERDGLPTPQAVRTTAAVSSAAVFSVVSRSVKAWEGFWRVCPTAIVSQDLFKRFENRGFFPDTSSGRVIDRQLTNGSRMLFTPSEVANLHLARTADVSGVLTLQAALRARRMALKVVLVPEKYTVYAPLLEHPPADPDELYLNHVEQQLRSANVPVVNLLPAFRLEAVTAAAAGRAVYFSDDTHWNAAGVRLAVGTILK